MATTIRAASVAAPTAQLTNVAFTSPSASQLITMLSDRQTLVFAGASFSAAQIGTSTDGGGTITYGKDLGGGSWLLTALIETPGGEVLAAVKNRTGLPAGAVSQLWRSTGWNKATANATTWTQVLASSGPGVTFEGRWGVTQRSVAPAWSARAGAIFVSEYGAHVNEAASSTQAAVRAWMSTDDGVTWTQIFDLRDRFTAGLNAALHVHGIAYDPYDDRVFISSGDGGNGDGGQCAVWYCDGDKLAAPGWTSVPGMQGTTAATQVITIIPTPSAILFTPDTAALGIWRLPRRGYRRYGPATAVAQIGVGVVGAQAWQNPDASSGAPLLLTHASTTTTGPPSILLSTDGATIVEAWRGSTATSGGPGVNTCVGPDLGGKVYANYNLTGTGQLLTADYQPNAPAAAGAVGTDRQILTGPGLTGGGDLTADRTINKIDSNAAARSGLIAHTYPGHLSLNTTTALTPGTVYVAKVYAEDDAASAVRTVRFFQNTASSGLTLAKTAVFDAAGTQLGVSSDQSTQLNSGGNSARNIASGTFALTKGAAYYIAFVCVGTTGPILTRTSNSGVNNAGLTGANLLWATQGTGQTDMPASITPASGSAQTTAMWFGLY